jgi:hypothetical protein
VDIFRLKGRTDMPGSNRRTFLGIEGNGALAAFLGLWIAAGLSGMAFGQQAAGESCETLRGLKIPSVKSILECLGLPSRPPPIAPATSISEECATDLEENGARLC